MLGIKLGAAGWEVLWSPPIFSLTLLHGIWIEISDSLDMRQVTLTYRTTAAWRSTRLRTSFPAMTSTCRSTSSRRSPSPFRKRRLSLATSSRKSTGPMRTTLGYAKDNLMGLSVVKERPKLLIWRCYQSKFDLFSFNGKFEVGTTGIVVWTQLVNAVLLCGRPRGP